MGGRCEVYTEVGNIDTYYRVNRSQSQSTLVLSHIHPMRYCLITQIWASKKGENKQN